MGPESAHSPNAEDMTALYWVMFTLGVVLLVAINGALIGLAIRYRAGRGRRAKRLQSRGRVQGMVGSGLAVLAAAVFVAGVIETDSASDVGTPGAAGLQASTRILAQRNLSIPTGSDAPLEIQASGQQWIWRYQYPDSTFSYYELVVPVDTPVLVKVISTDVLHRWWVPGLSAKTDAIPGTTNTTWFKADEVGDYEGASYAFSGPSYSTMRTQVHVVSVPEYEAWLKQQSDDIASAQAFVQKKIAAGGPLAVVENSAP